MTSDEPISENSTALIISGYRSTVYHTSRDCPHVQQATPDDIREIEPEQYPDREECRERECGNTRRPNGEYNTGHRDSLLAASPDDIEPTSDSERGERA